MLDIPKRKLWSLTKGDIYMTREVVDHIISIHKEFMQNKPEYRIGEGAIIITDMLFFPKSNSILFRGIVFTLLFGFLAVIAMISFFFYFL